MTTREEEIEDLAKQLFIRFHLDGWDAKAALDAARKFYDDFDFYRAARQPAPEAAATTFPPDLVVSMRIANALNLPYDPACDIIIRILDESRNTAQQRGGVRDGA